MATRLPPLPSLSLQSPPPPPPPPPPPSPPSPPQQIIISPPRTCTAGVDSCSPLCPNLCSPPLPNSYNRYPDDPSNTPSGSSSSLSPLLIALISILAAAFLLVSYYALSTSSFFRRNNRGTGSSDPTVEALQSQSQTLDPNTGLDESLINRIALLKYRKNDGLVVSTDCSVCLGEFKEEESLRLLPECTHAFHVDCIDKWLESHSNCPICRASVLSAPQPVQARVVPRVQPRETENQRSSDNNNNNINSDSTSSNVRNVGGNHGISNLNPPLIREDRRSGGLVVIVDPGPVGRVQEIIEVGEDSIRPVSRHPTFVGTELKPLKSSLVR